ncbi:MAG: acyltransferase family protein [Lachnospiraceae bacterium]|nr:acyltransferase family protein [Lachnospiraceae bacterium]
MTINKKFLQVIAAFQILFFHLWAPLTSTQIEQFILKTAYVGVDMFFFLSAYSLAGREIDYVPFLKDRVLNLYAKFAFFVLIMALFSKSFGVIRAVKSLTFIEFFQKGGGAFLWFIPAILILYIIYPLFLKWNSRLKVIWVLLIWLTGSVFAEHVLSYTAVFIFTNRIPVILAGYLFKTYCTGNRDAIMPDNNKMNRTIQILRRSWVVLIPLGALLLYMYGFKVRLNFPIKDMFYVLAIPTVLGLVTLSSYVKKCAVTESLGSITLELYAVQMIFGQRILIFAYNIFNKNALLTNVFVTGVMLLLAYIISYVIKRGERLIIK